MDDDLALITIVGILGMVLMGFWVVDIVPTWLVIQGSWESFPWWLSLTIQASRVLTAIMCPLYLLVSLTGKLSYFTKGLSAGVLALWGYPVYRRVIMDLAFTELSGLELQRAIPQLVFILALTVSVYNTEGSSKDE